MKTTSLLTLLCLFLATTSPVAALGIIIDSTGKTAVYNQAVLGETTEAVSPELQKKSKEMVEQHKAELRKQKKLGTEQSQLTEEAIRLRQENEKKLLQQQVEAERRMQFNTSSSQKKQTLIKTVSKAEHKYFILDQDGVSTKVELRSKNSKAVETLETDQLELEIPSTVERETEELRFNRQIQAVNQEAQQLRKDNPEDRQFIQQVRHERVKAIIEARKERLIERVQLRRAENASKAALLLTSRDISAEIDSEYQVAVDPATNEIGLVSSNGQVMAINHLPDQAKARLSELGKLREISATSNQEFKLTLNEQGEVVYKLTAPKRYKLLGLFNRNIATAITLDDSTGEIVEERLETSGLSSWLDWVSF